MYNLLQGPEGLMSSNAHTYYLGNAWEYCPRIPAARRDGLVGCHG